MVELGRVRQPKADLNWIIYDENRALGGFTKAIGIGNQAAQVNPKIRGQTNNKNLFLTKMSADQFAADNIGFKQVDPVSTGASMVPYTHNLNLTS